MSKYPEFLVSQCIENYDTIKEIVNTMSLDQLKLDLKKIKTEKIANIKKDFIDMIDEFITEYYHDIPDFTKKIVNVNEYNKYESCDNTISCKRYIEFDSFRVGISYSGYDSGDSDVIFIIGSCYFPHWHLGGEILEAEIVKIMEFYGLDLKLVPNFKKLILRLCKWYNNLPFSIDDLNIPI
jgi:hypothetical protein